MGTEPDPLIDAARTLAMTGRLLERSLDDLTLAQYRVLAIVASSPERAGRVAERAAMSRPTLTGILDGLAARGWIARSEVSGDRRGVHLEVTAAGRTRLTAADRKLADALADVIDALGDRDRRDLLDGLGILRGALAARLERRLAGDAP